MGWQPGPHRIQGIGADLYPRHTMVPWSFEVMLIKKSGGARARSLARKYLPDFRVVRFVCRHRARLT